MLKLPSYSIPEDGLYEKVNCNYWRSLQNSDGAIDDSITIKKV